MPPLEIVRSLRTKNFAASEFREAESSHLALGQATNAELNREAIKTVQQYGPEIAAYAAQLPEAGDFRDNQGRTLRVTGHSMNDNGGLVTFEMFSHYGRQHQLYRLQYSGARLNWSTQRRSGIPINYPGQANQAVLEQLGMNTFMYGGSTSAVFRNAFKEAGTGRTHTVFTGISAPAVVENQELLLFGPATEAVISFSPYRVETGSDGFIRCQPGLRLPFASLSDDMQAPVEKVEHDISYAHVQAAKADEGVYMKYYLAYPPQTLFLPHGRIHPAVYENEMMTLHEHLRMIMR